MRFNPVIPQWHAPPGVSALCTTRYGGFSNAPYDKLNLAMHVGDAPELVVKNRLLLQDFLDHEHKPCWLNQTHSARVVNLDSDSSRNADASVTGVPDKIAVVMTADCLPILLANRDGSEVAAIHAGWRGLAGGVIESTLDSMASRPEQLVAWIGPAISQKNFEVGDELRQLFVDAEKTSAKRFMAGREGHWMCDLPALGADCLYRRGVSETSLSGFCSFEEAGRFYSYRRDNKTGRMATMIWINSGT